MSASAAPRRIGEFAALFLVLPGLLWVLSASGGPVPVIPLLLAIGTGVLLHLRRSAPTLLTETLARPWSRRETWRVAIQVVCLAALVVAYVLTIHPDRFLDLPLQRTSAWLWFLAVYPLLSVLPQEIIFRAFLFHRYAGFLRTTSARILVSALVFGLAHSFYGNWGSVGLSTLGGLCFSWTFARTGSLALVVLEHTLYGTLLFSLGLGRLFYLGTTL